MRALIMLSDTNYAIGKPRMPEEDNWADQTVHWTQGIAQ